MNFLSRRDFEEKEGCKNKHKKKHTVFDRAFDISIRVQNRQELNTESRIRDGKNSEALIASATCPRLRIIAAVIRHLPFRIESVRAHRSVRRQKRSAKGRIGPIRFQSRLILDPERCEVDSFASIEIEWNGKLGFARERLVAAQQRGRTGCVSGNLRARQQSVPGATPVEHQRLPCSS